MKHPFVTPKFQNQGISTHSFNIEDAINKSDPINLSLPNMKQRVQRFNFNPETEKKIAKKNKRKLAPSFMRSKTAGLGAHPGPKMQLKKDRSYQAIPST